MTTDKYDDVGDRSANDMTHADRLYSCFQSVEAYTDLPIALLWERIHLDTSCDTPPRRQQQQVGAVLSRLNDKLKGRGERIVPGRLKRTYRLTKTVA